MKLKITAIGNSAGVILPKELLAKLRLDKGDELYAVETPDGIRLTTYDPVFAAQMEVAEPAFAMRLCLSPHSRGPSNCTSMAIHRLTWRTSRQASRTGWHATIRSSTATSAPRTSAIAPSWRSTMSNWMPAARTSTCRCSRWPKVH